MSFGYIKLYDYWGRGGGEAGYKISHKLHDVTVNTFWFCSVRLRKQVMMEHDQNMIALNNHLQMTRLRQQKRYVIQPGDFHLGKIHLLCFLFPFFVVGDFS